MYSCPPCPAPNTALETFLQILKDKRRFPAGVAHISSAGRRLSHLEGPHGEKEGGLSSCPDRVEPAWGEERPSLGSCVIVTTNKPRCRAVLLARASLRSKGEGKSPRPILPLLIPGPRHLELTRQASCPEGGRLASTQASLQGAGVGIC
ncbi:unnamed protein product [Caretta caretta]